MGTKWLWLSTLCCTSLRVSWLSLSIALDTLPTLIHYSLPSNHLNPLYLVQQTWVATVFVSWYTFPPLHQISLPKLSWSTRLFWWISGGYSVSPAHIWNISPKWQVYKLWIGCPFLSKRFVLKYIEVKTKWST